MKFQILVAAGLFALSTLSDAVQAQKNEKVPCDPKKAYQTIYYDNGCKNVNYNATAEGGFVPEKNYYLYTGKCEPVKDQPGVNTIFNCDEEGFHWGAFTDKDCTKPLPSKYYAKTGFMTFEWNQCTEYAGVYLLVNTNQTFNGISVGLNANNTPNASIAIDGNKINVDGGNASINMSDGSNISVKNGPSGNMTWNNFSMEQDGYKIQQWQGESEDELYMKQIQEFDKFFYYAIDHMGAKPGSAINSCNVSNECTQKYQKHCCVNAVMTDENSGKEHSIYRCMNERVADANFAFSMNSVKVSMKCVGGSAASALTMSAATAMVGLVAFALS